MWSLAGFNIKMIEWSPYALAAGRSLVAVILLAPMVLRKGFQKIDRYVIGEMCIRDRGRFSAGFTLDIYTYVTGAA